ncbi:MAG: class I SAM-dependent methyltransferase [Planctomycetota bacterium]
MPENHTPADTNVTDHDATATTTARPASQAEAKPAGKSGAKRKKKPAKRAAKKPPLTAKTADRHALYQEAVQNVESEIDFVDKTFKKLRGRHAERLREDFCGTGNTSCEFVRRRSTNHAFGLDIDEPTLRWGRDNCVAPLKDHQQERVHLINRDVREPEDATEMDVVLAMNFSYWLFQERRAMVDYFRSVHASLKDDGVLFTDFYGGTEAGTEVEEERSCKLDGRKFTYIWDQNKYNAITGEMNCFIHFKFPDGTKMKKAFSYTWRLWGLPEMQDVLRDAGFSNVTVYWEGDEKDENGELTGEGNGIFRPTRRAENCESFICYIVAEK